MEIKIRISETEIIITEDEFNYISTSWWEGKAIMGRSQRFTIQALENILQRIA